MSYKIDVDKLTDKLTVDNIKTIMESLGATLKKEDNKQIIYDSICHSSSKPKLYFWKELRIQFTCFTSCGNLNIYRLVMKVKNLSFTQALEYICDVCNIPYESTKRLTEKKTTDNWKSSLSKYTRYKSRYSELTTYDKNILNFFEKKYHDSWLEEGITIESMEKYKIGWYPYRNCITIPVFDREFNLVGIRSRNLIPEVVDKYKYIPLTLLCGDTYSFPTNSILYGVQFNEQAIRRTKTVLLIESEKAVIKLDGWLGDDNNSLAMYGSNLSKKNRDYLLKLGTENVVIVADNDFKEQEGEEFDRWQNKQLKLASMFKGMCKVEIAWDINNRLEYKQNATDKDYETFKAIYDEREEVIW